MPYKDPEKRRAYQREYHRRYYLEHAEAEKVLQSTTSHKGVGHEPMWRGVKGMSSCVDCGESNPIVLDFDHVHGDKSHNISDMVNGSYAISSIKDEIRKCEIRCSNCHRKKTHERRNK